MKRAFYCGLIASITSGIFLVIFRLAAGVLTPPEVLVDIIVRLIPLNLFLLGVSTFGSSAKIILLIVLAVLFIIAGGLVGMLWHWLKRRWSWLDHRREWVVVVAVSFILWVLAMVSLVPASGKGFFGIQSQPWPAAMVLVWLLASFAYTFTFAGLFFRPPVPQPTVSEIDSSRRTFLKRLAYAGVGLILVGGVGAILWKIANSTMQMMSGTGQLSPEITPNADFYVVSKDFSPPQVDSASWKLQVTGLVDHELSLSYEQLKALPPTSFYLTLECISNEVGGTQIGNAQWKGVLLRDVMSSITVKDSVRKVVLYGADDYADSITPQKAMADDVLLAYEMNGVPVPPEHGYPVRLLVPGIYGMKNVKWLNRIDFVDQDFIGFWEQAGWSDQAVIKTMSRIDVPASASQSKPHEVLMLGGVAFAGDRGVSLVEVSTDGGKTWNTAAMKPALSPFSWVIWVYNWTPVQNDNYIIQVRATDGQGNLQSDIPTPALPDGASGYDSRLVVITPNPSPTQQ